MPLQCGTWKKRFFALTGPIATGSKSTSNRGSRRAPLVILNLPQSPGRSLRDWSLDAEPIGLVRRAGYPPAAASNDALPPAAVVSTQRWRTST